MAIVYWILSFSLRDKTDKNGYCGEKTQEV